MYNATGGSGATGGGASNSATDMQLQPANGSGWSEFCERHARAAATDFAKSCVHYIHKNLAESARGSVSHREFMQKFIACFAEQFDSEFMRRRSMLKVRFWTLHSETGVTHKPIGRLMPRLKTARRSAMCPRSRSHRWNSNSSRTAAPMRRRRRPRCQRWTCPVLRRCMAARATVTSPSSGGSRSKGCDVER